MVRLYTEANENHTRAINVLDSINVEFFLRLKEKARDTVGTTNSASKPNTQTRKVAIS